MKTIVKKYNINSKLNKNIVLISDIHYQDKKDIKRLNIILEKIKEINPNYICIAGDITNKSKIKDESTFLNWLTSLSNITKTLISIGNHEYYVDKHNKVFKLNELLIEKINQIDNLYLLNNKNIILDDINFIGMTLPIEYYSTTDYSKEFKKMFDKINIERECYNILLCHTPEYINKEIISNKNIDLVLCGHMHGGVVPNFLRPIIKHRGLISPNKTLFPKNSYGKTKINNTNLIISRGCRVLTKTNIFKPEIVVIKLTKS